MVSVLFFIKALVCAISLVIMTDVLADGAGDFLRLMEQGECHPAADELHKIALTGNAEGQLAFGYAASQNLCGTVELGGRYSIDWFRLAAEQSNAVAQAELARKLVGTWNAKNEEEALVWYRLAAEQGNANAQFGLAQMYDRGRYVSRNIPKSDSAAMDLYLKAAAQGHVTSYLVLSQIYRKGQLVEKDESAEAYWNKKGAESGDSYAQNRLADMYKNGRGVIKSDMEARSWYDKSAKLGSSYAKTNLAKMLRDGEGGPINTDVAIQLFREAAEADEPNAQYELGKIYLEGLLGVRRDRSKACRKTPSPRSSGVRRGGMIEGSGFVAEIEKKAEI